MKVGVMINQAEFADFVERLTARGVDVIDAVLTFCEERGLEVETVAGMVRQNQALKAAVQQQAESINVLPKIARLPLD